MMKKPLFVAATAAMAMSATFAMSAVPAHAAGKKFANCNAMHKVYPHGVAKSKAAAAKQVRAGNGRPAVKKAVYVANKGSDRDKDGTACEA